MKRPPSPPHPPAERAAPWQRTGGGSICMAADRPPDEVFQIRVFNAGNSCYIDSVLFAMFAVPSPAFEQLLAKRLVSSERQPVELKTEMQAFIHKQFAGRIARYENVTADVVTSLRRMCRRLGWEYPGADDQQQDAAEFYSFLHGILGGQLIRTMRRTFTGALPDPSDRGLEENMTLLPVSLGEGHHQGTLQLSGMLDTFFYENLATGLRRMVSDRVEQVDALNTYSVENVPGIVAVSLKRFDDQLCKIESEVHFPTHINLHKYSSRPEWRGSAIMHSVPWNLRGIVCHRGASIESGHYYSYCKYSKNGASSATWLRMDDNSFPCISQGNASTDPYVKTEAVLFLYELDTDAHTAALMTLQEDESQGLLDVFSESDAHAASDPFSSSWGGVAGGGGGSSAFPGSRSGPLRPEAGSSVPQSRGGPLRPEAVPFVPGRALPSGGGPGGADFSSSSDVIAHSGRAKDAAAAATPPVLPEAGRSLPPEAGPSLKPEAGRSVEPFSSGASLPPEAGPSRRISSDAASSALRAISAMVGGRGAAGAAGGGGAQPLLAAHSSAASSAATGAAPEATPGPLGVVVTPDGRASISPTLVQREPSVSGKGETETWDTTLDVTDRSRPLLVCLAALPGFKWDAVADEMIEVTCSCGELPSGDKEGGKGAGGSSANGSNGTNCSKSSNGVNGSKSLTRERPSLILDARELLEGGAADLQGGVTLTLRFRLSKLE